MTGPKINHFQGITVSIFFTKEEPFNFKAWMNRIRVHCKYLLSDYRVTDVFQSKIYFKSL